MLCFLLYFLVYFEFGLCLWTKGVVHYAISNKDYDLHSQEIITGVISDVQKEICLKFFDTPPNYSATVDDKILYINNPDKRKICPPDSYNYTGSVVDMVIGYKCINPEEITRIIVDMLRASIEQSPSMTINSYDLVKKFQEQDRNSTSTSLLSPADRNYINSHYHTECRGTLSVPQRRYFQQFDDAVTMSRDNYLYYKDKLWPLGVVMYGVEKRLQDTEYHNTLKQAMTAIELASCVVFQEVEDGDVLRARSLLWFASQGADAPQLGFVEGNQTISLVSMTVGAPGHSAHTLNLLLRALGIPMQSNRHDRDFFVNLNWNNVKKGKEHYLEKLPTAASLHDSQFPYDFDSATHAPANFMCEDCSHGETTIQPAQDHLWQRTMTIGHTTQLSKGDKEMLHVIYSQPCRDRYAANT